MAERTQEWILHFFKKLRDLIQSQKIMLGRMEVDLMNKSLTIDYLTQQLMAKNAGQTKPNSAADMISFM
jgi:hypothetical protein